MFINQKITFDSQNSGLHTCMFRKNQAESDRLPPKKGHFLAYYENDSLIKCAVLVCHSQMDSVGEKRG